MRFRSRLRLPRRVALVFSIGANYAARGRTRGLLCRLNSKVQAALREIEDAEAALDAIYEQGLDVRAIQAGYLSLARRLR